MPNFGESIDASKPWKPVAKAWDQEGTSNIWGVIPYGNFIGNLTHPYLVGGW
jgi:hypothetical protein